MGKRAKKIKFRDVSSMLQALRAFLLGRKHTLHLRFEPKLAPRSIPAADIARGPEYKYSEQYYYKRSPLRLVKPPIVAPIAEGPPISKGGKPLKPDLICFDCAPAPGLSWGWDGHNYYDDETCPQPSPKPHQSSGSNPSCESKKSSKTS